MVNDMVDLGPFMGSDHKALTWLLEVRTKLDPVTKYIFDYAKADIESMKQALETENWVMPQFSMLSFHSLSLLARSSSVSATTTRSSAYNNSHGKATLHSQDKASMTITNS